MGTRPERIGNTSINTSDGAVKSEAGLVYWVLVSSVATGGAWQLNDSTDDGGTDLVSGLIPANDMKMITFDPAIEFATGIYADIPGSNITLTVGYW